MMPPMLEITTCPNPRCARPKITRPLGAETWHPCGVHVKPGETAEQRKQASDELTCDMMRHMGLHPPRHVMQPRIDCPNAKCWSNRR